MNRLALLVLVVAASPALADRREAYVLLEAGAAADLLLDGPTGQRPGTAIGPAGELQAFYGLTNSLHVGVYARGGLAFDVAFPGVQPTLQDGSRPTGALYANTHGFGGGLLARWRFDTGFAVAPFLQLELGGAWRRFRVQQLIPTGRDFAIGLPDVDTSGLDGRLVVGGEYRIGDHLLLELLVGARRSTAALMPWQLSGSAAVGVVW